MSVDTNFNGAGLGLRLTQN